LPMEGHSASDPAATRAVAPRHKDSFCFTNSATVQACCDRTLVFEQRVKAMTQTSRTIARRRWTRSNEEYQHDAHIRYSSLHVHNSEFCRAALRPAPRNPNLPSTGANRANSGTRYGRVDCGNQREDRTGAGDRAEVVDREYGAKPPSLDSVSERDVKTFFNDHIHLCTRRSAAVS